MCFIVNNITDKKRGHYFIISSHLSKQTLYVMFMECCAVLGIIMFNVEHDAGRINKEILKK